MRVLQYLSLVLPLALTAHAGLQDRAVSSASSGLARTRLARSMPLIVYQDFLLTNINTHEFAAPSGTSYNRTITFHWSDPNSNTTTCCTESWIQTNTTNAYPQSYVLCDSTGFPEAFQWYFSAYTSLSNFTFQLGHEFLDPVAFPPPYDEPQYFGTVDVTLNCTTALGGYTGCYLPAAQSPLHAAINGISD